MILNLQFRENVAAWVCFYDRKELFKAFLERVLRLKEVCLLFLLTTMLIRAL
jgi:intron-binding protein aquarius